MKVRGVVAWVPLGTAHADSLRAFTGPEYGAWQRWTNGQLQVRFVARESTSAIGAASTALSPLLLGDDAEWDPALPDANLACGVPIRFDAPDRTLVLQTSIVGLPPVFVHRGATVVAVASDIHLLTQVPGVRLEFDPRGVTELGRFGHPVEHRTLFRSVELVPCGGCLRLGTDGRTSFTRTWALPPNEPLDRAAFIDLQMRAFSDAMRRTGLSNAFLSLTGGLDTRTIFAVLADQQRLVPTITMSGKQRSLDARIAARLCRTYGVRHELVIFGEEFERELPRYVELASRLSGGLSSVGQAPEIHLYEQSGREFAARLSGNLGNQVGRGGTESLSLREGSLEILAPRLVDPGTRQHWLLDELHGDDRSRLEFILQSEIVFSSVANYSLSNYFAVQQSPYANRSLIETLARKPSTDVSSPSGSMLHMRVRDIKHRFLGEPESFSFQRALVNRLGGAAAAIPVNWGWRPKGGVSAGGLLFGLATFAGMAASAKGLDDGLLRRPLQWSGLPALHDFRESRRWLRETLRTFVFDTLHARSVREAELFDRVVLDRLLEEHFGGRRDHYESVTFALDLTLAQRHFCSPQ